MWSKRSWLRQADNPEQIQCYAHWALAGCSWLGARMDSTIGLVRCTSLYSRRQKDLSMYLPGGDPASTMLCIWVCCVNKFSSCGLLLSHSQSYWYSATNNCDITRPFGSLGSVFFPLDLHHRFRNEIQVWQITGDRQLCPSPKRCWILLTPVNFKGTWSFLWTSQQWTLACMWGSRCLLSSLQ